MFYNLHVFSAGPSCIVCRASQWANHFEVTNLNKDKGPGDAYTYDLEWSPDAIKPPIHQKVKGVPPAYIECVPHKCRSTLEL